MPPSDHVDPRRSNGVFASGLLTRGLIGCSVGGLVGGLIGLTLGFVVFDRSFFFGATPAVLGMSGDAGSSFAGLRFFVNDDWHFPLLETHSMRDRTGAPTIIALTDSIPLLSLVAKVAKPLGLSTEAWIGIWFYACFALQGACAALAARAFGARRLETCAAAAVLAVSAPTLFLRIWHPGLLGQFTLLLALAATASILRSPSLRGAWLGSATILLALLVHPYFFAMSAVLVVGAVASVSAPSSVFRSESVRTGLTPRGAAGWLLGTAGVIATLMFLLGYLPSEAVPAGGFGAFGINVVGPIWPQWSTLWPGDDELLLSPNGSFEGIVYFGAGAAVLVVAMALIERRRVARAALDHQVLTTFVLVLIALAVTPMVQVGPGRRVALLGEEFTRLNSVPFVAALGLAIAVLGAALLWLVFVRRSWEVLRPGVFTLGVIGVGAVLLTAIERRFVWDLLQQFRASGRFFWIVGYGMVLWALVALEERIAALEDSPDLTFDETSARARRFVVVAMSVLAIAQVADTSRYRSFVPDALGSGPERTAAVVDLADTMATRERVRIATSWFCSSASGGLAAFQDVVIAASIADVDVDRFYGGRTSTDAECETTTPTIGSNEILALPQAIAETPPIPWPAELSCERRSDSLVLCFPAD